MKIYLCSIIFFVLSCGGKTSTNDSRIKEVGNLNFKGKVVMDSLFDGMVKCYDLDGNYRGYSFYKCGLKEGPQIQYYKNGKIADSLLFHHNMQDGFSYQFNESGILAYKSYYLNGLPIGHIYEYDSNGNIIHYSFVNFEHKIIYELYRVNGEEYREGDEIQMNLFSENSSKNDFLFLYLFDSPFTPRHYEIGILDSTNRILSSETIAQSGCYYERELPHLQNGHKYAVILHRYNSLKKRDNLVIKIAE